MYTKELRLAHHELPAKYDLKTEKYTKLGNRPNNLPEGKALFGVEEVGWTKHFNASWEFLDEVLTDLEFKIVNRMCRMAKMNTNSLQPLDDSTTIIELSETFGLDRRRTKKTFDKLFNLGIYGKFEVVDEDKGYTKYWVLNPYLSFSVKLIDEGITTLFEGTRLTKEYRIRQK